MPLTVRQRNLQNQNGVKKILGSKKSKKTSFWKSSKKSNDRDFLISNAPTDLRGLAFPGSRTAFLCLLSARLAASTWIHISDCDETYNYWEPLHYLVYGSGLQTWEYSPVFALRSYFSLWVWAAPARLTLLLAELSPTAVFYLLRCVLATLTALSEAYFYKAVCAEFGVHVARVWLALYVPAAGAWATGAAMLPSAWSGALTTAALAAWWHTHLSLAVCFVAASALLSWPFAGLLGLPIALDMLMRRRWRTLLVWGVVALVGLLAPCALVDSWHYGRPVLAPWNLVRYNLFSSRGPQLYGVEPWTYYFVNGFLNFNIVWVLALCCPGLLALCAALTPRAAPRPAFCRPYWLSLAPLYLWLAVFLPQPHKEERFLFPAYSALVLCGAVALDCVQKMVFALWSLLRPRTAPRSHYLAHTTWLMLVFLALAGMAGVSRIVALHGNYHAPMGVLRGLPPRAQGQEVVHVCWGKEWHRAPPSFLLPGPAYHTRFIKTDFRGQLPAPFSEEANGTRLVHSYFNDNNVEDTSSYLAVEQCHYLVESDVSGEAPAVPLPPAQAWRVLTALPLLDAPRSPPLLRAFHVPLLSRAHNVYGSLYLLQNQRLLPTAPSHGRQ